MRSDRVASLPPPLNWVNRGAREPRTIIDSLDEVNAWLKERPVRICSTQIGPPRTCRHEFAKLRSKLQGKDWPHSGANAQAQDSGETFDHECEITLAIHAPIPTSLKDSNRAGSGSLMALARRFEWSSRAKPV
jgi:hypothetical protein